MTETGSNSGFQFTDFFMDRATWQKVRKPIISTVILFQFTAFILYLLLPNMVMAKLTEPFQRYLAFFCLYQGYGVFSPSPSTVNSHMVGLVSYQDGSTKLYAFPRLERISLLRKLTQERYRKFTEDNLPHPSYTNLVADVARYVARKCDVFKPDANGFSNRPRLVILFNYYSEVPPLHKHAPNPPHFKVRSLCSYLVKEEDLE